MVPAWLIALLLPLAAAGCNPGYSDSGSDTAPTASPHATPVQTRAVPAIGTRAPDFQLWNLDGTPAPLPTQRGRVFLLIFWAPWWGPCRIKMPAREALYHDFDRRDF